MKYLVALAIICALAIPVSAGTITIDFGSPVTITTTAAQDVKLTRALSLYNAETGKSIGMELFIKQMILAGVQSYIEKASETEALEACVAYNNLGTSAKNQIVSALGGKSPCR